MSSVIDAYLQRMEDQREEIFRDLGCVPESRVWTRFDPGKWSAGELLDHTRVLNRFFRRMLRVLWPVLLPMARIRQGRAYPVEIDNVYQRPNMPSRVGVLWSPHFRPDRPVPVPSLGELLADEHRRIGVFFRGKDERLLGNCYVWDPAIGWLNFIQTLRVGIYHDQHHYAAVRRLLRL
jgi:hypothetical protein